MLATISQQLVQHEASNEASIVMVDFNSKYGLLAALRAFNNWAEAASLANGPYKVATTFNIQLLTRVGSEGGAWIYYILHTDNPV